MATKEHLRKPLTERQNGRCACGCEQALYDGDLAHMNELARIDHDGPYTLENTELLRRECHQAYHGIESAPVFPALRAAFDNRHFWMKERRRLDKQLEDVGKSAWASGESIDELERQRDACARQEKYWSKRVQQELRRIDHPMASAMQSVPGIGWTFTAFFLSYVDISKAPGPRSICQHLGIGDPHHYWVRSGNGREMRNGRHPGKKWMRAECRLAADQQRRQNGPYATFIRMHKEKQLFRGDAESGEELSRGRADSRALRYGAKEILKHAWQVYRELEGLPINRGVEGYTDPRNYGWEYEVPQP